MSDIKKLDRKAFIDGVVRGKGGVAVILFSGADDLDNNIKAKTAVNEAANQIGTKMWAGEIAVSEVKDLAMRYKVRETPAIIVFKNGKVVRGLYRQDIERLP